MAFFMIPEKPEKALSGDDSAQLRSLWSLIPKEQVEEYLGVFSEPGGLTAARRALEDQPDEAAVLHLLGEVYLSLGNDLMAERFLRRAIAATPDYAPAWMHLGALYLHRGEGERGHSLLLRASQLAEPGSAIADQAQRLMAQYFP